MNSLQGLISGPDPSQRLRVRGTLTAAAIYALSLLAQWHSVLSGLTGTVAASGLAICTVAGN